MYELEKLFDNTAFVLNFILQIILLIVFLRLAWNVGKLRKRFVNPSPEDLFKMAELKTFQGKIKEAVNLYLEYIYKVKNEDIPSTEKKYEIERAVKAINKLGEKIPESTMMEINQYL